VRFWSSVFRIRMDYAAQAFAASAEGGRPRPAGKRF
jgi:hypothetical protein